MNASIAIPHYRNHKNVERIIHALEAVFSHSALHELIIVNDGSESWFGTDMKAKLFDLSQHKMKLIDLQKRTGVANARNQALKVVSSDLLFYLDQDCLPSNSWFQEMITTFAQSEIAGVGGRILPIEEGAETLINNYLNVTNRLAEPVRDKKGNIVTIITANSGFKVSALKNIGGFNSVVFDENAHGGEDVDLTYRLARFGYKLTYNPNAIVYHEYLGTYSDFYKKYFFYGKGMRLFCEANAIQPKTIGQPTITPIGIGKYIFQTITKLSSDFLHFRKQRVNYIQCVAFSIFEFLRRSAHLHGFIRYKTKLSV